MDPPTRHRASTDVAPPAPELHRAGIEGRAPAGIVPDRPFPGRPAGRHLQAALAGLILLVLAGAAWHFNARPRHEAFAAMPDTLRGLAATVLVFAVAGFGAVRLLLPAELRRYEPLW